MAQLEEYLQRVYVHNYTLEDNYTTKPELLNAVIPNFLLPDGTRNYVINDGKKYFLINKSSLPQSIQDVLAGGDTTEYTKYIRLYDVYGVTEDLKVYYCNEEGINTYGDMVLSDADPNLPVTQINSNSSLKDAITAQLLKQSVVVDSEIGITIGNMAVLDTLEITGNVTSLDGISEARSLINLTLTNLTLPNLNGLESCIKLEFIYFNNCTITDYSKLAKCSNLKYLYMNLPHDGSKTENECNDEVSHLSSAMAQASDMHRLENVGIWGYDAIIRYHYGIGAAGAQVEGLKTNNNNLSNIEGLSSWNNSVKSTIKYMYLNSNNITDISCLSGFSQLYELWVFSCHNLENLNGLGSCKNLTFLVAQDSNLKNISGLDGCASLKFICIKQNSNLSSLDGIKNCSKLEKIYASNCNLTDINDLVGSTNSGLKNLNYLGLSNNVNIEDVSSIAKCTAIRNLYLSGNTEMIEAHVLNLESIINLCGTNYSIPDKYKSLFLNNPIQDLTYSESIQLDDYSTTIQALKGKSITWLRLYNQTNLANSRLASLVQGGQLRFEELATIKSNLTLTQSQSDYIDSLIAMGEDGIKELSETQVNQEALNDIYFRYVLSTLTSLKKLSVGKISKLTSIDFVNTVTGLRELDLRGTSATDLSILETNASYLGCLVLDNKNIDLSKIQNTMTRIYGMYTSGSDMKCCWLNKDYNATTAQGLVLLSSGFNFSNCKTLTKLRINFYSTSSYSSSNKLDLSGCEKLKCFFGFSTSVYNYVLLPANHFESIQPYYSCRIDGSLVTAVDQFYVADGSEGNYFFSSCTTGSVKDITFNGNRVDLDKIALMAGSLNSLENINQNSASNMDFYFNAGRYVHGKLSSLNVFTNLQKIYVGYDRGTNDILSDLTVSNTTNLKNVPYISLRRSGIGNFSKLKLLTGVETLVLTNNVISDLTGIEYLTNIKVLYLDTNKLENLSELEKLITTSGDNETTTLRELYLKGNPNLNATSESGYNNVALLQRLKSAGCTTIDTDLNIN